MIRTMMMIAALALAATAAQAETFEVQMKNKGEGGVMVFEPAFVNAQPGDVIHFVPADKGHNVESIAGMLPEGVEAFKSKFNAEFKLTLDQEGLYGIKCSPHYAMGMVALIKVADPVNRDAATAVKHKGKARGRMADLLAQIQ